MGHFWILYDGFFPPPWPFMPKIRGVYGCSFSSCIPFLLHSYCGSVLHHHIAGTDRPFPPIGFVGLDGFICFLHGGHKSDHHLARQKFGAYYFLLCTLGEWMRFQVNAVRWGNVKFPRLPLFRSAYTISKKRSNNLVDELDDPKNMPR